jgi:ABC-2 type transport system ATP-binding protein/lipopolysaccharide transport system ATP-binding protein
MNNTVIEISDVTVRYRLSKEKPKTIQEYIVKGLKGKKVEYEYFTALNNISMGVMKGEAIGIIGHNGAGKSTLLKVIAKVLTPTEGRIQVNGSVAPLIELGAGFDMELTGKENIYLNASILGLSRKQIDKIFDKIVDFSELSDFIYSPLKSYSSGMIARLGFSIATEVEPDILIIDEILAVGDEHFKRKCKERITRFKHNETSILFVSHSMTDVTSLCNKVLWLHQGNPKMFDMPDVVIRSYMDYLAANGSN